MDIFLVVMGAWLMFAIAFGRRVMPGGAGGGGGQALRAKLDAVYSQPHEYQRVELAELVEPCALDAEFYQRATERLVARGLRNLGDVEDVTLAKLYPDNRTVIRQFLDTGGMVRGAIYHLHPRGFVMSMLQVIQVVPRQLKVVELVTEMPRGKFLVTSNTRNLDRLDPPPEAKVDRLDQSTSLDDLVDRHQERVRDHLREHPHHTPQGMESYDDVMASVMRGHAAIARHRRGVGGISVEELERLKGRPLNPMERAFVAEVQNAGEGVTKPEPPLASKPETR